jgi:hypothetical protein
MKPVSGIVRDTVEQTEEAWKASPCRELIPADILKTIDGQIGKVVAGTKL